VRAIEAKVGGERLDVSVRLVVVARSAGDVSAATVVIEAMRHALEQTQSRSWRGVQRLVPAGLLATRSAAITSPRTSIQWRPWLPWLGLAGLVGLAAIVLGIPTPAALGLAALPLAGRLGWNHARSRELARVIRRAPRLRHLPWLLPAPLWPAPPLLGLPEVATLWALPDTSLLSLVSTQPNRILPVPADLFVPDGASDWVVLGHAQRSDGVLAPVGLPLRSLRQILHLTSGMGGGKTQASAALIWQLIPWGCLVLDGKGDDRQGSLVGVIREQIPLADEGRLVLIDPLDADWPIGLNPLADVNMREPAAATQALGTILSILARLDPRWSESLGMQQYAQMAAMLILEGERAPTLANLKQALQDEHYRQRLLERCTNIEVTNFWTITFPKTSSQQKNSLDALLRRLDSVFVSELTRYLVSIPEPTVDLNVVMEEGYLLLFPLPHNTLGELAEFVAMLVFWSIVRAAYRRPGTDQTRATVPVLIDEFQIFAGEGNAADVRAAISQLRSLGIGSILAHQALDQVGDLRDELLQNAANRLILRTGEPDSATYARMYAAYGVTSIDIAAQPPADHQYLVAVGPDRAPRMCSIQPLPWPKPVALTVPPPPERDWQTILPAARAPAGVPLRDAEILGLVYRPTDVGEAAAHLAGLSEEAWEALLGRWRQIRTAQRAYLLANPGAVPERLERQRWLSRLRWAWPRVLAAAGYQRQRWAINPQEPRTPVVPRPFSPAYGAGIKPASTAVVAGLSPRHPPVAPTAPTNPAPMNEFDGLGDEAA